MSMSDNKKTAIIFTTVITVSIALTWAIQRAHAQSEYSKAIEAPQITSNIDEQHDAHVKAYYAHKQENLKASESALADNKE